MKKYKCIGLKETHTLAWAQAFEIGQIYEEAPAKLARAPMRDTSLFLYDKDKHPLKTYFVDKDQFEECTS